MVRSDEICHYKFVILQILYDYLFFVKKAKYQVEVLVDRFLSSVAIAVGAASCREAPMYRAWKALPQMRDLKHQFGINLLVSIRKQHLLAQGGVFAFLQSSE